MRTTLIEEVLSCRRQYQFLLNMELPFRFTDDLDVEWTPHPNWYWVWSKQQRLNYAPVLEAADGGQVKVELRMMVLRPGAEPQVIAQNLLTRQNDGSRLQQELHVGRLLSRALATRGMIQSRPILPARAGPTVLGRDKNPCSIGRLIFATAVYRASTTIVALAV